MVAGKVALVVPLGNQVAPVKVTLCAPVVLEKRRYSLSNMLAKVRLLSVIKSGTPTPALRYCKLYTASMVPFTVCVRGSCRNDRTSSDVMLAYVEYKLAMVPVVEVSVVMVPTET